jgi:uncharacterized coiled-coil protein SlyX
MSSVWGKLFGNRPTPANDAPHLSNHYEPDNETSEAWDASNGWGQGHRRGGDLMPAMIARTFDSKLAEPLLPAEPAPDALLRFGPLARRGAGEPLLKRSTPAALSSASPEFVQPYASSATKEPGLPHRAGPWRLAGWGVLGVGAPSLVAVAIVMLSPALRSPTPLESTDQATATHPRAPSAAPAIPAADMTRALPGEPRAPLQIGEAAASPVHPDFKEGMAVPPSAIAVSAAPPPATSPLPTLASKTEAEAERFIAEVERKMDALSAEVGRKMDALSAEMDALFAEVGRAEAQWYSSSPEQNKPPASPPPAVAVSPASPPATSPIPTLASETGAEAERFIAEVERKMDALSAEVDALFAEVGRLEGHQDSTSPEQNKPPASPPPAVAVSPASPPATSPVLPLASEAAAGADRPVAAVELERDAAAQEVDRLQSHRDSTSPEPATPLASPPPAVAVSPAPPPATSPVLPLASEAAADADRPVAAVERESEAMAAEVGRLEGHQDSTSPKQATPLASSPPAVAVSPAPPPATSPVLPLASEAAADADRPAAAVELERDAAAQEVDRLQSHRDSTSPEPATPLASPPPAIAPSQVAPLASLPASPPATSPVLPPASEAAADADRPVAAVERESDAMAAEVDRLQSHRGSISPEQVTPPASLPPAVAVSPAPPPATSPVLPPASEAVADADRPVAAVERESDAMAAEVGRLEGHHDSTSPKQATPPASPPPVIAPSQVAPLASLPASPPATSPVLPLASETAADADRPVAAVELERDAAAEVDRLQNHRDSTSPEPATPLASPPPAVAVSPVAPPTSSAVAPLASSPVLPLASEAAADADRRIAAVERKMDALSAEVGRLQSHRDSISPEQATPPASRPPVFAVSPVAPLASSPVLPLASEAAADADRRIAAVERKMDALSAEVGRLQSHRDSISPEQATPPASLPPAVAVSPAPPPATSPVLPPASEAAADADRPIAAVGHAAAAEVDRLQSHRDSTAPEQNKPPASSPPAVAVSPVAREDARPDPPVVHAGVADLTSDETCRRDGDRLARLRASPSGEETQRFASELGCEALRPQLQRLMESLGLVAPVPPTAANSTASSNSVPAQVCASEQAALDRLRKEPSAEAARLFWRDLKCARLRPQVRLLMDSLNATPRPLGSAAEPGEADSRSAVTIDAPTANGTDSAACRRETPELDRIRATLDLGDANRFAMR